MARDTDDISMALFCDFENIALGVRDAQYEKFDIKPVLERLLLKGSIVVKKAYCDWDRYKAFKAAMHEANFELIEIPHVRQSGKNSADIRMVVDALDLCYTKAHVNTFVIISGDSDFSPLVSKLRENAKRVIGVGVKQSTSDLLIANCDEFIYVDDLVRKRQRETGSGGDRQGRGKPAGNADPQEMEARRTKGIGMAVATLEALLEDRADDEKVWASVVKEALKRRHPGFNEAYHGFKTFGGLLEDAHKRGLLEFGRDEKSGAYVKRRIGGATVPVEPVADTPVPAENAGASADAVAPAPTSPAADASLPAGADTAPATSATPAAKARRPRGGTRKKADAAGGQAAAPSAKAAPRAAQSAQATPAAGSAPKPARTPRAPRRKKAEAAAE